MVKVLTSSNVLYQTYRIQTFEVQFVVEHYCVVDNAMDSILNGSLEEFTAVSMITSTERVARTNVNTEIILFSYFKEVNTSLNYTM